MAEPDLPELLGQSLIAAHIGRLLDRVKKLELEVLVRRRSDDLDAAEFGRTYPGENVGEGTHFYWPMVVDETDAGNQVFSGRRLIPSATSLWIVDPDFTTKALTVAVPSNVSMPVEGDVVCAFFTGVYSVSPSPVSRYGLFGAGGGGVSRYIVLDEEEDALIASILTSAGAFTAANTVRVAKPFELRKTPFHGQTIEGVTYDYDAIAGVGSRLATHATSLTTEAQFITPSYIDSFTIIDVTAPANGTGVTSVTLQDVTPGRAWAYDPLV